MIRRAQQRSEVAQLTLSIPDIALAMRCSVSGKTATDWERALSTVYVAAAYRVCQGVLEEALDGAERQRGGRAGDAFLVAEIEEIAAEFFIGDLIGRFAIVQLFQTAKIHQLPIEFVAHFLITPVPDSLRIAVSYPEEAARYFYE
jgi:hypothetical protein